MEGMPNNFNPEENLEEQDAPEEKEEISITIPEDMFQFDMTGYEEDYVPDSKERAKQIGLKLHEFISSGGDKEMIKRAFEESFYERGPASNSEEASFLLSQIYEELDQLGG